MAMHTNSPEMGGHVSNLAYQSMDGPAGGGSPRTLLLKTSSQEVKEAMSDMVNSAAK
jgi:hypothetical protein